MARTLQGYVVADPKICHGQLTFRGTRILVSQVLDEVASGRSWEGIIDDWGGAISKEAISDAVRLARRVLLEHQHEFLPETADNAHPG
ncbi:MAG TPA: DUF433 domain-containing protein [Chloroflexota bacterium]|nr:DUF433 domain-containing protein [Chloroflexota bacterium]